MRFKDTVFYSIDELLLDQENYRFGLATSQKECIDLIYRDSPESFENLLKDIIENNIGDYPLVFINSKDEKIVLDGNRRVSILKIIHDPRLAPSKKIEDILNRIDQSKLSFDLNRIGCFVSTNKEEILKTVYERHAAGKGISRIQWSAFATAKFRYDSEIEDSDWRAIAILLHVVSFNEEINSLIKKPSFSFEVFRRMIRHAYLNGYLHFEIFNEEKNIINPEVPDFGKAIDLVLKVVKAIDNGEVGLSRGKNFASEVYLTEYFSHYFSKVTEVKPPRKKRKPKLIKPTISPTPPEKKVEDPVKIDPSFIDATKNPVEDIQTLPPSPQIGLPFGNPPLLTIREPANFIEENIALINSLNKLSIPKYSHLYQSISQLNIKKHVILAVIATWAFLDSLPRVAGWKDSDFTSYYNSHIKNLISVKEMQTDVRHAISWLYLEGNCNKHSSQYITLDHKEFIKHFNNIQSFISKVIEQKILPSKTVANDKIF